MALTRNKMPSLQANAIKEDVGYPLYIKDDWKLDQHYSMVMKIYRNLGVACYRLQTITG